MKEEVKTLISRLTNATTSDENRFVVAQDIIDRLVISNCFSVAEITEIIKNELKVELALTEQETQQLLKEFKIKRIEIDDKLKIAKMKQALYKIKVEKNKIIELTRKIEVEQICKELIDSNFICSKKILFQFIMRDLCNYFTLTIEEKQEIKKEVREWMLKN